MRHDYDLPAEWEAMTDEQRSRWMTQERCRRQAMSQRTPYAVRAEKAEQRMARRVEARNSHTLGET